MMDERKYPKITSLFVYDQFLNTKEGDEHEKILYFYPPNTCVDDQVKHMGLIEALCQFTKTFNCKDFDCFRTQKTIQVFREITPPYNMVMIISVPLDEKYESPLEHGLSDKICGGILEQAYDMFKLFLGSVSNILKRRGVEGLKQRLAHFFPRYLSGVRIHEADLLSYINGVPYLALDRLNYLKVQCFLNLIEASFPLVKYTTFLYNDSLVASSLLPEDTRVFYRYLTSNLLPAHPDTFSTPSMSINGVTHMGRFVCGPPNLRDSSVSGKTPKLYLHRRTSKYTACMDGDQCSSSSCASVSPSFVEQVIIDEEELEDVNLVVYRAFRATICLFLSSEMPKPIPFDFFLSVDSFLGTQLTSLSQTLKDACAKQSVLEVLDSQHRFLCFNSSNHALKSSIHVDGLHKPVPQSIGVTQSTVNCMDVLHEEALHIPSDWGEVIAKTEKDVWLVAKKSSSRRLLFISQKGSHLLEVDDDCHKLCASQFGNIFFLE